MNWNSNDTKYILKRFIIYVLICVAMFIIGSWKVKAISMVDIQDLKSFRQEPKTQNFEQPFNNTQNGQHSIIFSDTIYFTQDYTQYNTIIFNTNISFQGSGLMRQSTDGYINYPVSDYSYITLRPILGVGGTNYMCTIDQPSSLIFCPVPDSYSSSGTLAIQMFYTTNLGSINGLSSTVNIKGTITRNTTFYYGNYNFNSMASGVNNINDSINNDNVTTSDADDFSNNQAFNDSTGLESVIQLPLNMVNSLTSTCQPIQITIPFIDYTGEIPCMSTIYKSKFNTLYTIVKIVINGFFVYRLLLKVYELVHNAKQPDEDKLEVIDL